MKRKYATCGFLSMPRELIIAASLLFCAAAPEVTSAATFVGDSSTYVRSRQEADSSRVIGAYEYLDLEIRSSGSNSISFHSGGWLRYDLASTNQGDGASRSASDLRYSYLSFKHRENNAVIDLGRVMVFDGIAAERVDGVHARAELARGFAVSGFGGSPVEVGGDTPGNNVIYGGRVSHHVDNLYQVGVSALKEEKNGLAFRREEALDVSVHPVSSVNLNGRSSYNAETKGVMEHAYSLVLGPFAHVLFDTSGSWINYKDYFTSSTSHIFSLSSGVIDPNEKAHILGEAITIMPTDSLSIRADYKNYRYTIAGKADYYGGGMTYARSGSGGAGISYHRMVGQTDQLRYDEYRAYGFHNFGALRLTADYLDIAYKAAQNGVKDCYSATLGAHYALSAAWKAGADVEYAHNPDFSRDVRAFLKLQYHFGTKGGV